VNLHPIDIGVLVGSLRKESINRRLAQALTRLAPSDLRFYDIPLDALPMYNGDLETDRPVDVDRFTALCTQAQGFLVVMPEHNRSIPAVLKNAIDWGSKPMDKNVWRDKPVVISGTSPGAIGTAVGQQHLRQVLGVLGSAVLGGEAYVQFKPDMLDDNGDLRDSGTNQFLAGYMERFAVFSRRLVRA
jgi:chromate reductase